MIRNCHTFSRQMKFIQGWMIAVIVLMVISANAQTKTSAKKPVNKPAKSRYYKTAQVNVNDVINYMDSIGIKHSEIVIRQAILETGHFKSRLLMDKNNLFAFRYTRRYIKFENWQASVDYYKKWQDKYYKNEKEDYYLFLKRIKYAHAGNYITTLKRIKIKSSQ